MEPIAEQQGQDVLRTLPGDDVRQILWRFADRYDLQMLVQSSRAVARGPVARLVAEGARNSHEWTDQKAQLLKAFDESGITALFMDPAQGGFVEGPKNLAMALIAFELSWVDAGAATCSLAGNLGLAPIHERGTPEQRDTYMRHAVPPQPGEDREIWRGAFSLTEPLPYVGVETGLLGGKVRVAEWEDGQGADAPGGQARAVHHQHGLRQLRDRRRGLCRPADQGQLHGDPGADRRRGVRPRGAHQEAGPPALLDVRPGLQPARARQPDHRRVHREGRRDRPPLQPRRDHRGGLPPHARDRRTDDGGQAPLRGGAGDPLPARPLPGRREHRPGLPAVRARSAAEGGRPAPAGGHLGHGGGRGLARFCGGAPVRRAGPAGTPEGRALRRTGDQRRDRPASRLSPGAEGRPGIPRPRRNNPRLRGTSSGIRRSRATSWRSS